MNVRRVLVGGLVAGLLSNVLGIGFVHWMIGDAVHESLARFDVRMGGVDVLLHVGLRLSYGLLAVWLYAGLRPRLGPGPRTALAAAFAIWWAMVPVLLANLSAFRIYPAWVVAVMGAWSLVEMALVSICGAWIYREHARA